MLIDTHCHLDASEFDADRDAVFAAGQLAGVAALVIPAVERANFASVTTVCKTYPACTPAYGIHPMYVERADRADLDVLRDVLSCEAAIAVGEIGLDGFVEPRDDARQEAFFGAQLEIARDAGLPVLLHVRRAVDRVLYHLRRTRVVGGIAHAFNGSRQQADEFLKLGFKLGVGGTVTFSGSSRVRALVAQLPDNALVLETDAPDIPPEWLRGARNVPAELPRIAAVVAGLRNMPVADLISITRANALAVLPRLALHLNHGTH